MKPTLLILAAGTGSRYGGLKQLEKVGPNGETLLEYSVYDAIKTGFGKIVFVIRRSFEKEFRDLIVTKIQDKIAVEVVYQEVSDIPNGIKTNPVREKPWGSAHALWAARNVIKEPFGVVNGDDFYGRESFQLLIGQLVSMSEAKANYIMIPYRVGNTLVDSGTVARAVCEINDNNYLTKLVERTDVMRLDGVPSFRKEDGTWENLTDTTLVSMNMWGFTTDVFDYSAGYLQQFFNINKNSMREEALLPSMMNYLVYEGKVKIKVMNTPSKWFGITHLKDRNEVSHKIEGLIADEVYPDKLF